MPCAICLSALHMPSGQALALSGQCCSAFSCSVNPAGLLRLAFIAMIVAGIVGLKIVTP